MLNVKDKTSIVKKTQVVGMARTDAARTCQRHGEKRSLERLMSEFKILWQNDTVVSGAFKGICES